MVSLILIFLNHFRYWVTDVILPGTNANSCKSTKIYKTPRNSSKFLNNRQHRAVGRFMKEITSSSLCAPYTLLNPFYLKGHQLNKFLLKSFEVIALVKSRR